MTQGPPREDTRDRLINTALRVFAAQGFEGTSTRDLARLADVTLSAISYHFGGKLELYVAVAEHAADIMARPVQLRLEQVWALLGRGLSTAQAVDALVMIADAVAEVMLAPGPEGMVATQFSMRDLVVPGPGAGIVEARVVEPILRCAMALLRIAIHDADESVLKIQATTLFGPITVYRILHNQEMGEMSAAQGEAVLRVVRDVTRGNILALARGAKTLVTIYLTQ